MFDVKTCSRCEKIDFDELGLDIHLANYCEDTRSGSIASRTCKTCSQFDYGQTGEYPCRVCGLPTLHDAAQPQNAVDRAMPDDASASKETPGN